MTLARQTSLRLGGDLFAALDFHARQRQLTRSALVREILTAWAVEHRRPARNNPPLPSREGQAKRTPTCARCGRAIVGPAAVDAARLQPLRLAEVTRWACGLCATTNEAAVHLACRLVECGEAIVGDDGALWSAPHGVRPLMSAGRQLQLPPAYPRQ